MVDLSARKKNVKQTKLELGVPHEATVTAVDWAKGFVPGSAYEVFYELTDASGNVIQRKELFYNDDQNERTLVFESFLNENGIRNPVDFIGCKVKLTFLKDVKNNKTYVNIVKRTFVSSPNPEDTAYVGTQT